MIKSTNHLNGIQDKKELAANSNGTKPNQYKKLLSMGRSSKKIINELYNPIDATNRFINLALESIGEDSQGRQFLLESKTGIRKASLLLKRLNIYLKKMEKELGDLSRTNG
jgi:hypothetical protein